jgi:hypothetical protein
MIFFSLHFNSNSDSYIQEIEIPDNLHSFFDDEEEYVYDEDVDCFCWYDEEYDAWYWLDEDSGEWLLVEDEAE